MMLHIRRGKSQVPEGLPRSVSVAIVHLLRLEGGDLGAVYH